MMQMMSSWLLWLAVLGHEEDILENLDTVQVSQNPFFESKQFW
jgi:hypothetical protein